MTLEPIKENELTTVGLVRIILRLVRELDMDVLKICECFFFGGDDKLRQNAFGDQATVGAGKLTRQNIEAKLEEFVRRYSMDEPIDREKGVPTMIVVLLCFTSFLYSHGDFHYEFAIEHLLALMFDDLVTQKSTFAQGTVLVLLLDYLVTQYTPTRHLCALAAFQACALLFLRVSLPSGAEVPC